MENKDIMKEFYKNNSRSRYSLYLLKDEELSASPRRVQNGQRRNRSRADEMARKIDIIDGQMDWNKDMDLISPQGLPLQPNIGRGVDLLHHDKTQAGELGLLDIYPNTSGDSWALHKLKTSFTGDVIEIKRDNGDVQRFGFDSNGELPYASEINSFVGAGDGKVSWWKGQSNSTELSQSSNGAMPFLYKSGSLQTEGGEPSVVFEGAQWLTAGNVLGANEQPFMSVAVAKASGDDETIYAKAKAGAAPDRYALISNNSLVVNSVSSNVSKSFTSTTAQAIYNQVFNSASKNEVFLNDVSQGSTANPSTVANSTFEFLIGAYNNAAGGDGSVLFLSGSIQELHIVINGQTWIDSRSTINSIINDRYNIY